MAVSMMAAVERSAPAPVSAAAVAGSPAERTAAAGIAASSSCSTSSPKTSISEMSSGPVCRRRTRTYWPMALSCT